MNFLCQLIFSKELVNVFTFISCTADLFGVIVKVAMGQGQSQVAMMQLRECAQNGEWLCLKNLHLVTSWLPTLEKVSARS